MSGKPKGKDYIQETVVSWGGWRPGGGRPPLPDGRRRSHQLRVALTPGEVERLERAAGYMGYNVTADFARHCLFYMIEECEGAGDSGSDT